MSMSEWELQYGEAKCVLGLWVYFGGLEDIQKRRLEGIWWEESGWDLDWIFLVSRIECDLQHGEVIYILGQRGYLGVAMEKR